MKSLLIRFVVFFVGLCNYAQADALKNLSHLLQQTKTVTASFTQTISDNAGQTLSSAKGKMLVLKPGYFRWQIASPAPELIVVKHGMLYYLQSDLQQLTVRHFNVNATQTPAALLLNGNYAILSQQYKATEKSQYNDITFTLTPKASNQLLAQIKVDFNNGVLQKLQLADHFNRVTTVVFSHFKTNVNISKRDFDFKLPKGTDIIHD